MYKIFGVVIFIIFLLFTGCASLSTGETNPRLISATIENYKGAKTFMEAYANGMKVGSGFIDTSGRFSLELVESLEDDVLTPMASLPERCPDITLSDLKLKRIIVQDIVVGGSQTSKILQTNWNPDEEQPILFSANLYMYANRAAMIKGTCEGAGSMTGAQVMEYDLDLKKGWNLFEYQVLSQDDEVSKESFLTGTGSISKLKWYIHQTQTRQ